MKKSDIISLGLSYWIVQSDISKLLEKILEISSKDLFFLSEINEKYFWKIEEVFLEIHSGKPLEHILEYADFYGYTFYVTPSTLIPKNDTEVLVEKTIEYLQRHKESVSLVDIWTGTGCIPISIYKEISKKIDSVFAIDISKDALVVAEKNAKIHWVEERVELLQWDLFSPLLKQKIPHLVITANLPYIKDADFKNIDTKVMAHEPHLALFGGEKTWFELYEKLIIQLQNYASAKTLVLFIEIGFDQWEIAKKYLDTLWVLYEIFHDNGWIDRCIKIQLK